MKQTPSRPQGPEAGRRPAAGLLIGGGGVVLLYTLVNVDGGGGFRVPGHPFTTALFAAACALIVTATFYQDTRNSALGLAILATGVPVYLLWRKGRVDSSQ